MKTAKTAKIALRTSLILLILLSGVSFTAKPDGTPSAPPLASAPVLSFPVNEQPANGGDNEDGDNDGKNYPPGRGKRIPPRPVWCEISQSTGVLIGGISRESEILSYEIIDAGNNSSVAILCDEISFMEVLFSLKGEYKIVFMTAGSTFQGYVCLE